MKEGVLAIVLQKESGAILLVKRRDAGVWALPGGGLDPLESAEVAAFREVKEETHINCKIVRMGAYFYPVNRLAAATSIYVCETTDMHPLASEESSAAEFFSLQALPDSLFYLHRQWIAEVLQSDTLIRRPLKEVNYIALLRYAVSHPITLMRFLYHKIFVCIKMGKR